MSILRHWNAKQESHLLELFEIPCVVFSRVVSRNVRVGDLHKGKKSYKSRRHIASAG